VSSGSISRPDLDSAPARRGGERDALLPKLRELLDGPGPGGPNALPVTDGQTEAAVLVAIYLIGREPHVVLTRRRADLRRHAGEISFPGGRRDPADVTLAATALREAQEEIGLPQAAVSIAGQLMPTSTFVTNYAIHPFVGAIAAQTAWGVNAAEVDAVLELSLRALRLARGTAQITRRGFTFETDAYELQGHLIWGATARILDELIARLAPMLD
jgi:8-oxo-dGTP pyrophosphatase MutT (NUDIX family)